MGATYVDEWTVEGGDGWWDDGDGDGIAAEPWESIKLTKIKVLCEQTQHIKAFLDKSINSMLSAIEIYNKPNFSYREETYAILAINSLNYCLKPNC